MINFEELAQAMGDLDEDAMVRLLNQVMAEGGKKPIRPWPPARKVWTPWETFSNRANISWAI